MEKGGDSMKQGLLILLVLLLMIGAPVTLSQKVMFRVAVEITAKDDNVKSLIESYIKRELRSLGDVEVVKKDPHLRIEMVCIKHKSKDGDHLGYAFATAFTRKHSTEEWLKTDISEGLKALLTPVYVLENLYLKVGGRESIKSSCQEIVADLDTEHIERLRSLVRSNMEK